MQVVRGEMNDLPVEIEDKVRIWAFHAFYRSFAAEQDLKIRFARSIIASARPVRDREALIEWSRRYGKRHDSKTT